MERVNLWEIPELNWMLDLNAFETCSPSHFHISPSLRSSWDLFRGLRLLVPSNLAWSLWALILEFTLYFHITKINSPNIHLLKAYRGMDWSSTRWWHASCIIIPEQSGPPSLHLSRFHPLPWLRGQYWPVGRAQTPVIQIRNQKIGSTLLWLSFAFPFLTSLQVLHIWPPHFFASLPFLYSVSHFLKPGHHYGPPACWISPWADLSTTELIIILKCKCDHDTHY